jgi:hypothetical protein
LTASVVRTWDAGTGEARLTLTGHTGWVRAPCGTASGTSWLSRPISVGGQAEILGISVGMLASCVVVTDEWTRIECYCDTVPRAFSDIESIGSFTLFIGRSGHSYYARPIGPLSGAAALGEFDLVIGGDCLPISPRSGPSTRCSGGWPPIRGSTFPYDQLGCQIKSYESGRLA